MDDNWGYPIYGNHQITIIAIGKYQDSYILPIIPIRERLSQLQNHASHGQNMVNRLWTVMVITSLLGNTSSGSFKQY